MQARAGRTADVVALATAWDAWPLHQRGTVTSTPGPGGDTLWSDCSMDDRDGWLQDRHFCIATLARLALPVIAEGHFCRQVAAGGKRQGQECGIQLTRSGRHLHGACSSGVISARIHHAVRRRLAAGCKCAGLRADEETVVPDLHYVDDHGKVTEARMDIIASRPGGLSSAL